MSDRHWADPPPEIGTDDWWNLGTEPWEDSGAAYTPRGPCDAILRLLEQKEITRAKARELLFALDRYNVCPGAPWDKVYWGAMEADTDKDES